MTALTSRSIRRLSISPGTGVEVFGGVGGAGRACSVECPQSWHWTNSPGGDTDCAITRVRALPQRPHVRSTDINDRLERGTKCGTFSKFCATKVLHPQVIRNEGLLMRE